jgi:hypothetical protein
MRVISLLDRLARSPMTMSGAEAGTTPRQRRARTARPTMDREPKADQEDQARP